MNFMNPSIVLTTPYIDPPNTFRATALSQCYSIFPNVSQRTWDYSVGVAITELPSSFKVRNNTVSNSIKVVIMYPSFLKYSGTSQVIIAPGAYNEFVFSMNEDDVEQKVMTRNRLFEEYITFIVTPMNVTGPVFVNKNLAQLV